jgi:hypothetical protein
MELVSQLVRLIYFVRIKQSIGNSDVTNYQKKNLIFYDIVKVNT